MLDLNSNRLKHMGTVQGLQGCVRLRYALALLKPRTPSKCSSYLAQFGAALQLMRVRVGAGTCRCTGTR